MAEEIGDQLQDNGVVTIADLAKTYDLPGEFLNEVTYFERLYFCAALCGMLFC